MRLRQLVKCHLFLQYFGFLFDVLKLGLKGHVLILDHEDSLLSLINLIYKLGCLFLQILKRLVMPDSLLFTV